MRLKSLLLLSVLLLLPNFVFSGSSFDEGNEYFNYNLAAMDDSSKILLLQCIKGFPKINKADFNKNLGFLTYDEYSSTVKKAEKENKPVRPKTYNEVNVETINKAFARGVLDKGLLSDDSIKKALIGATHPKFTSWYYKNKLDQFDYDNIVRWAAKENGIPDTTINSQTTSQLEESITEKFFGRIWDGLEEEEKVALLSKLSEDEGIKLTNGMITSLAATGTATLVLSSIATSAGFAPYLGIVALITTARNILGVTIPWAVYQGATTFLKPAIAMSGPIGWSLIGLSVAAEGVYLGFTGKADVDSVSAFIMSFHQLALENQ